MISKEKLKLKRCMKKVEFKTSKGEFLGVLVPDEAYDFELNYCGDRVLYANDDSEAPFPLYITLPKGQYKIIGIQTEITEEQATIVVDQSINTGLFAHYVKGIPVNTYCYKTSLESFNSLMQKLEIKPDKKTLIIQKIK